MPKLFLADSKELESRKFKSKELRSFEFRGRILSCSFTEKEYLRLYVQLKDCHTVKNVIDVKKILSNLNSNKFKHLKFLSTKLVLKLSLKSLNLQLQVERQTERERDEYVIS